MKQSLLKSITSARWLSDLKMPRGTIIPYNRNGTSMISLIIPPNEQISEIQTKLTEERGKAARIKSRANRQSVIAAIVSSSERLKLYSKIPTNGLVIYCGSVISEDGRSVKKLIKDFEPYRPINGSAYFCGEYFYVDPLRELLEDSQKYGFIVLDGSGVLFATLQGHTKIIIKEVKVDLPKKHNKGGQSAPRFGRLRVIKRHNYLHKVSDMAVRIFIIDNKPNVSGLILAGSGELKNELYKSDLFDPRLSKKVLKVVDVSYGSENGFNEAIRLSEEVLENVNYIQEKNLIAKFFNEINIDSPKIVFGVNDTMRMLEMSVVDLLIIWEDLDYARIVLVDADKSEHVIYLKSEQLSEGSKTFKNLKSGIECQILKIEPLNEWLIENYKNLGFKLQFITDKSPEGSQFIKGFGGCGAFLRYNVQDFEEPQIENTENEDFDIEDDFI